MTLVLQAPCSIISHLLSGVTEGLICDRWNYSFSVTILTHPDNTMNCTMGFCDMISCMWQLYTGVKLSYIIPENNRE